ncbi:MAG: hypothetical protein H6673_05895 [Anaerolineales bacterium]|nr:hypothetical protein [Anaerolineales bacterium]
MFQLKPTYLHNWIQGIIIVIFVTTIITNFPTDRQPPTVGSDDISIDELLALEASGEGQSAVIQVTQLAYELGHWAPAPGDIIVYDAFMSHRCRGATIDYDELPEACTSNRPEMTFDSEICAAEFWAQEPMVRFGRSFFTTPIGGGKVVPRTIDDVLATFIEETGHSWQEYQFETDGHGGERIHPTTLEESRYWAPGREYQVKRYILSLDGTLLNLSATQRANTVTYICTGYANPIGSEVPPYSAPPEWPNPEGWPTTNPTPDELMDFCSTATFNPDSGIIPLN